VAVYKETIRAVDRARNGEGPTLIEASTYRHGGHHVNDPGLYMDQDLLAEWKARDPLHTLRKRLSESKAKRIEKEVDAKIDEAVEFAKNSPEPSVEEFLAGIQE
jgi:pyruvate dehydrogenase E1 component alpha subunit